MLTPYSLIAAVDLQVAALRFMKLEALAVVNGAGQSRAHTGM